MNPVSIKSLAVGSKIQIPDDAIGPLESLMDLVIEKNKVLNLTSIRDRNDLMIKQVLNSLFLTNFQSIPDGDRVADLGTGGGFPGLPLAIVYPKAHFTLIDSVQKKIRAVEEFAHALNLKNVVCLSDRLEALGQNPQYREHYDVVIAQALAPLRILLELAMPLVKIDGIFVAFKGPNYAEEHRRAAGAMRILGLEKPTIHPYHLPHEMGERFLLVFRKQRPTPAQFPRAVGVPNKKPL